MEGLSLLPDMYDRKVRLSWVTDHSCCNSLFNLRQLSLAPFTSRLSLYGSILGATDAAHGLQVTAYFIVVPVHRCAIPRSPSQLLSPLSLFSQYCHCSSPLLPPSSSPPFYLAYARVTLSNPIHSPPIAMLMTPLPFSAGGKYQLSSVFRRTTVLGNRGLRVLGIAASPVIG